MVLDDMLIRAMQGLPDSTVNWQLARLDNRVLPKQLLGYEKNSVVSQFSD